MLQTTAVLFVIKIAIFYFKLHYFQDFLPNNLEVNAAATVPRRDKTQRKSNISKRKRKQRLWKNCQLVKETSKKRGNSKTTKKTNKRQELKMDLKMKKDIEKILSVDCGDKECSLSHRFMDRCKVFLHTNVTDCKIPCLLDGCQTQVHHFMNCPVWECNDYTTTTLSTTTSSSTTTPFSTIPPDPVPSNISVYEIVFYTSIAINAVVIFALFTFVYYKCQKMCKNFCNRRAGNRSGDNGDDGTAENVPLIPRAFTIGSNDTSYDSLHSSPQANQNLIPICIGATGTNVSSRQRSPVSLSSTPDFDSEAWKEFQRMQREIMFARVTSFKPQVTPDVKETNEQSKTKL
jgi:hypothetical protein